MLVFSTCWNSHRHQDGEEMIDEILSLGFDHVELSHGIKLSLLPGIMNFPIWAIPHAAMLTTPHKLKINTKRPKTIR